MSAIVVYSKPPDPLHTLPPYPYYSRFILIFAFCLRPQPTVRTTAGGFHRLWKQCAGGTGSKVYRAIKQRRGFSIFYGYIQIDVSKEEEIIVMRTGAKGAFSVATAWQDGRERKSQCAKERLWLEAVWQCGVMQVCQQCGVMQVCQQCGVVQVCQQCGVMQVRQQ